MRGTSASDFVVVIVAVDVEGYIVVDELETVAFVVKSTVAAVVIVAVTAPAVVAKFATTESLSNSSSLKILIDATADAQASG